MSNSKTSQGKRIEQRRKSLDLTRVDLAGMAQISDKFLYDIELGKKGMSATTLDKLSQALGVSADWVLRGKKSAGGTRVGNGA